MENLHQGMFTNSVDSRTSISVISLFLAAVHEAVAGTMCQCRRLIIILHPEAKRVTHGEDLEEGFWCDDPHQHYEQKIGLFDALTQNDPKVILVELGEHIKILRRC